MKLRMVTLIIALFMSGCAIKIKQVDSSEKSSEVKTGSNVTENNTGKGNSGTEAETTEEKNSGTETGKATEDGNSGTETGQETEDGNSGTETGQATENGNSGTETEQATEDGNTGTDTERNEDGERFLQTCIFTEEVLSYNNISLEHSFVQVDNDGYEKLKSSLEDNANAAWNDTLQTFDLPDLDKKAGKENVYYSLSQEPEIMRGDETVLSFFDHVNASIGGPHPSYSIMGYTFDSQSGKQLQLEDVISDKDALRKKVLEQLKNVNKDGSLYDNYEQIINDEFKNSNDLRWALGSDGLKIHFEAYQIAPYAAGETRLEFPYEEYADLFHTKYLPKGKSWVRQFQIRPQDTVIEGNALSVSINENDNVTTDATIQFAGQTFTETLEGMNAKFWIMHLSKGKNFLCIEMHELNGHSTTYIYALKPNGISRTMDIPSGIVAAPSPKSVAMRTSLDAFWTFGGYKYYSLDDNGTFQSTDAMYKVCNSYFMELPLESVIPLEVEEVDLKTHQTIGKKVLPEGTFLYLYGTDGESFVEVINIGDMKHYRIPIQRKASGYGWSVNGKDEEDCFAQLYYAG